MFVKVSHKEERAFIYETLISQMRPIQIQLKNKKVVTAKAIEYDGEYLKLNIAYIEQFRGDEDVTVTFSVIPDIFFLKTKIIDKGNHYLLELKAPLHKLQRRDSFRLVIPENLNARVRLDPIDKVDFKRPFKLVNLSGGGFAVEIPVVHKDKFKSDKLIFFDLELLSDYKKSMKGRVRQVGKVSDGPVKTFRIGVEFQGLKKADQEELTQLITDLYRRYYHNPKFD